MEFRVPCGELFVKLDHHRVSLCVQGGGRSLSGVRVRAREVLEPGVAAQHDVTGSGPPALRFRSIGATDDDGRLVVELRSRLELEVRHPGYVEESLFLSPEAIAENGEVVLDLAAGVAPATLVIIVRGDSQQRLEHVELELQPQAEKRPVLSMRASPTDRRLEFSNLPPGRYRAVLRPTGPTVESFHDTPYLSSEFPIDLGNGDYRERTWYLRSGGMLELAPSFLDGIERCWTRLHASNGSSWIPFYVARVQSGDGGTYLLHDSQVTEGHRWRLDSVLEPGSWVLEIIADGAPPARVPFKVAPGETLRLRSRESGSPGGSTGE